MMKVACNFYWVIFLGLIFLGFVGCNAMTDSTLIPTVQKTETLQQIPTVTSFPTPTITPIPTLQQPTATITSTPEPRNTLTVPEQEREISTLLSSNGDCALPCIWGITAGESSVSQGIEFLTMLGFSSDSNIKGVYDFGYDWGRKAYFPISIEMQRLENSDFVKRFHIGFGGDEYLDHIQYYSIRNLLNTMGTPSEGWINLDVIRDVIEPDYTGYEVVLFYKDKSMVAKYSGGAIKKDDYYRICPSYPLKGHPELNNSGGGLVIWTSINTLTTPQDVIGPRGRFSGQKTIEEALGISLQEFVAKVVEDPDACFESKIDHW